MPKEYVPSMFADVPSLVLDGKGGTIEASPLPAFRLEVCWGTND